MKISRFGILEIAVFVAAQFANAWVAGPFSLNWRLVTGVLIAAFSVLRLLTPPGQRSASIHLALSAAFLVMLGASSAIAGLLAVLLITRCFELLPGDRRALALCTLVAFVVIGESYYTGQYREQRPLIGAAPALVLCFAILVILLVIFANDLRNSKAALASANAELRARARQSEEIAALAERFRIARDLHDEIGHGLTSLSVQLESAEKLRSVAPDEADRSISRARTIAAETLAALRRTVSRLREEPLPRDDLTTALTRLCEDFARTLNIQISSRIRKVAIGDPVIVTNVERIAREALTNVARHAKAATATILLTLGDEAVELIVEDDGVGFDPNVVSSGHGLQIMRERAAAIGATLSIRSRPGAGSVIRLFVPLKDGAT
jgi:signal transduction histidine kinase